MSIKRLIIPLIAIVALLGSVPVAQAFGWWQTTGKSLTTLTGATVDDIKGSSTLGEVATAFDIPQVELYALLGLPADVPLDSKLKDLESYNEVTTVREKISTYKGLPAASETSEAKPTSEKTGAAPTASAPGTEAAPVPQEALPASEIKGTMTLQQVSEQCAVPLDVLYKELGLKADIPASTTLKDLQALVSGLETTRARDVVAAYQASQK